MLDYYHLRRSFWLTPVADTPQGQKNLEEMAYAIRNLSLAVQHIPSLAEPARTKAEEILRVFFVDPETR
jgi:hypothetical protein